MDYIFVGFIAYFFTVCCITIAYYVHSRIACSRDYSHMVLGNRSVNYVLTAFSAHASDMSDWLFMAFPALLYTQGLIGAWVAIGLIAGMWSSWNFVAPLLRKATGEVGAITLNSYFEKRFHDSSGIIRLISAGMSVLFFSIYIAAGLKGFGFLCESIFAIPYMQGVSLGLACSVFFILFGGYKSLAWVDLFQALFLLLIIFIVPFAGYAYVGGWNSIVLAAQRNHIPLSLFPATGVAMINALLLAISWGVGYFGTPHILTKFMGIADAREIHKAKYIGMIWQISVLFAAGLSGLIGIAYFGGALANKELVFVEMVKGLFGPLSAGFILSAVAGATVSVVTAQMLVLISVLTEDFYKKMVRPQASEKEMVLVYRLSIVVIALLSFWVSLDKSSTIQQLVQYAWMGFAGTFSPLVLLSLHSTYINRQGAIACISIGSAVVLVWQFYGKTYFKHQYGLDIPSVIAAFMLSIMGAYIVSYCTHKKASTR